jgi:hypothetical protein
LRKEIQTLFKNEIKDKEKDNNTNAQAKHQKGIVSGLVTGWPGYLLNFFLGALEIRGK